MVSNTRRVALASLFGALTFVSLGFLPAVYSDYLIAIEAFFLALAFLVVGRGGATYTGVVAGLLIGAVNLSFFGLDVVFAVIFGLLTDGFGVVLGAKVGSKAKVSRLVLAMTLSTAIVGFIAYYVTAVMTDLVPNLFLLDVTILVFGVGSGALGGFLAAWIWNRYLGRRV